jgi:hypothetical protein
MTAHNSTPMTPIENTAPMQNAPMPTPNPGLHIWQNPPTEHQDSPIQGECISNAPQNLEELKTVLDNSAIFLTIFSKDYLNEPACVMQFGLAVLLDKPVYLLARKGTDIPENVRKIARKIVEFDDETDEENMKLMVKQLIDDFKSEA